MERDVHLHCHFAPVFPYRPEWKHKKPQLPQPPLGFPGLPESWLVEFEGFPSVDHKVQLFAQLFRPKEENKKLRHKALIVLHGQGEHSGRYIHLPHYLKDSIGSLYLIDHRGHGQSTGLRGHVDSFDLYAEDAAFAIQRYYRYLMEQYGEAEIHLLGHSMGGLIALRCLLQYQLPLASATISAPMIELAFPVNPVKDLVGKVLNRILPFVPIPGENLAPLVSRDPEVVKHYQNDPLNHGLVSPRFYFSYLEAKDDTIRRAGEIETPLLLLLPMADRIINAEATEALYRRLQTQEKKIVRFPGLYHEVLNEPEKAKALGELQQWIVKHPRESRAPG